MDSRHMGGFNTENGSPCSGWLWSFVLEEDVTKSDIGEFQWRPDAHILAYHLVFCTFEWRPVRQRRTIVYIATKHALFSQHVSMHIYIPFSIDILFKSGLGLNVFARKPEIEMAIVLRIPAHTAVIRSVQTLARNRPEHVYMTPPPLVVSLFLVYYCWISCTHMYIQG